MHYRFRLAFIMWAASLVWGLLLIGLVPDDFLGAQPLVALSEEHGPTAIDILGLIPPIISTAYYAWCLWRLKAKLSRWDYVFIGTVVAIQAARLNSTPPLVASVALSIGSLLVLGARVSWLLRSTSKRNA